MQKGRGYPQAISHWKSAGCIPQSCAPLYWEAALTFYNYYPGVINATVPLWNHTDDFSLPTLGWNGPGTIELGSFDFRIAQIIDPAAPNFYLSVACLGLGGIFQAVSDPVKEQLSWQTAVSDNLGWTIIQDSTSIQATGFTLAAFLYDWYTVPVEKLPWDGPLNGWNGPGTKKAATRSLA